MKILFSFTLLLSAFIVFSQFPIGSRTVTYNDPTRSGGTGSGAGPGRQIECAVYYPATSAGNNTPVANGAFPVVVFGHGFAMQWSAYQNIWEQLTPKGYILIFPKTEAGILPAPSHNDFGLDLVVACNRIVSDNDNQNSPFYQKVENKLAIMGHSMGGGATMLAAENNSNIKTIIGLAPAETNPSAIAVTSNIVVPALVLSGSADGVTPPTEHHQPIYNGISAPCKYFVSITGGAHCYFANSNAACDFGESTSSTGITITRAAQQAHMNSLITPWLNFYLKGDCAGFNQFLNASNAPGLVNNNSCNYVPITFEASTTDASPGQSNGSAFVSWMGGAFPVDFTWFNGSTNPEINNLAPGTYNFTITDAYCTLNASVTINDGTSGISQEETLRLQLSPNPTSNALHIELPNDSFWQLTLSDASGRVLAQKNTLNQQNVVWDLSHFDSGVFFLTIRNYSGQAYFERIIKN